MRIIQITDLHIGQEGASDYGVDSRANFLNILAEVKFAAPDYLVITGDLCMKKGEEVTYQWIRERLEKLDIPYLLIPGNHDSAAMMREVFEMQHVKAKGALYYALKLGKQTCLFIDNSKARHSEAQLNWLSRQLYQAEGELVIFSHYPLLPTGVAFMEKTHGLKDQEAVLTILETYADPIHIFCGHFHVEKTVHYKNINLHITPSCQVQVHPYQTNFAIDHNRVAMRVIDLEQQCFQTTVRYIDGVKV